MALRYWVGGGSSTNWVAAANTNWSATSGGSNNASVPGATDDVFFDANSGSGASVISAGISIKSLDCTGFVGTITHNGFTLTIANSMTLVAGMTYTPLNATTQILFSGATLGNTITTGGQTLQTLFINNASGSWTLQDNLTSGNFTVTAGIFNANNYNLSVNRFVVSGTSTVSCGSGSWTIRGTVATFQVSASSTFNYNTATFYLASIANLSKNIDLNGKSIYNLSLIACTQASHKFYFISDAVIVNDLTINGQNHVQIAAGATVTVGGVITMSASSTKVITIDSDTPGSAGNIIGNGGIFTYLNITDNAASGGSFLAFNSTDGGGNTGWFITTNPPSLAQSSGGYASASAGSANYQSTGGLSGGTSSTFVQSTGDPT